MTLISRGVQAQGVHDPEPFLGTSARIKKVKMVAAQCLMNDFPVLIEGPTGSGKGVLARWIHRNSSRSRFAFKALDCSTIPHELLESELFGHERGAFTGAITTSIGIFESADKGTLFLDEIGEMALTTQCKLLKVVEEGSLRRIGSTAEVPVDVRTISATNRDVDLMLEKGEFREDLFYRISILRVALPPLSERLEDIAPLSEAILRERFSEVNYSLADSAMDKLKSHTWPGNIRELRNVLCRAVVGCEYRDLIIPDDIEFDVGRRVTKSEQPHHLRTFKDKLISDALESTNGNVALTAKLLGVSKSGLHKRLRLNRGV